MPVNPDFRDLFSAFNAAGVRYLLVGGYAGQATAADLAVPEQVLQIGVPPNRVDLMTSIDGVTFDAAWPNRVETDYGDQHISVISRADLIANKRASGRPQDRLDIATLERHS